MENGINEFWIVFFVILFYFVIVFFFLDVLIVFFVKFGLCFVVVNNLFKLLI